MNIKTIVRKTFFTGSLILFLAGARVSAQQAFSELTPLAGYTLAESFFTQDGYEVYISDGFTYGGSFAVYPNQYFDVSLNYTRQEATVDVWDYYYNTYDQDLEASVNNVTLGFNRNQPVNDMGTAFFGGLNLGAAGIEPKDTRYSGHWKFDLDFHLGAKIFPNPKVGIRLQAGLNFPIQYFGAAFTVGTGGSGAGVSANSSITQLYFLGGLIIRLHK